MSRIYVWIGVLGLAFLLAACSGGNAKLVVNAEETIHFAGEKNLSLADFQVSLARFFRESPKSDEEPYYIFRFVADDATPFPFIQQVKDVLSQYSNIIRLEIKGPDGNMRLEEIPAQLTSRENRNYDYLEARNLFSIYLGADQQLYQDATLQTPMAADQLLSTLKQFIKSDSSNTNLPVLDESFLPGVGSVLCSKHHLIRVVPTNTTPYSWYNEISTTVDQAYDELYDAFAQEHFGISFAEAEKAQQAVVQIVYPRKVVDDPNISF
jgi:hypothetical protein